MRAAETRTERLGPRLASTREYKSMANQSEKCTMPPVKASQRSKEQWILVFYDWKWSVMVPSTDFRTVAGRRKKRVRLALRLYSCTAARTRAFDALSPASGASDGVLLPADAGCSTSSSTPLLLEQR